MSAPIAIGAIVRWVSTSVSGTVREIVGLYARVEIEVAVGSLQVIAPPIAGDEDSRRRLVDAAPDLLSALKNLVQSREAAQAAMDDAVFKSDPRSKALTTAGRAAIDRAEGRS